MEAISRMKLAMVAVGACVLVFSGAQAEEEKKAGIDIRNYPGNTPRSEKDEALKLKGNWRTGQKYYTAYCEACHLPSGAGNRDGSIPQLAGQHQTVLIKQLADIRSGVRYNPTMYPFARKLPGRLLAAAPAISGLALFHARVLWAGSNLDGDQMLAVVDSTSAQPSAVVARFDEPTGVVERCPNGDFVLALPISGSIRGWNEVRGVYPILAGTRRADAPTYPRHLACVGDGVAPAAMADGRAAVTTPDARRSA